jgi:chromosome segregation ATPase
LTHDARAANIDPAVQTIAPMDSELAQLEQKLASLLAHTRALRAANESLRRDLAAAVERNREMTVRVQQAGARLDALIARMPAE